MSQQKKRQSKLMRRTGCSLEMAARSVGFAYICGLDEAGRGPLAGPVVAAAVIMPRGADIAGILDSKKLSPKQREIVYQRIMNTATAWSIADVGAPAIDKMNILRASLFAMQKAVEGLSLRPDILLVDGNFPVPLEMPQVVAVSGDAGCMSIAAASILAKVSRDRRMMEYDDLYPGYGFAAHKGYGTAAHLDALRRLGPSPLHRRSFEPVRVLLTPSEIRSRAKDRR
jgi:ribonuclease HII